MPEVMVQHPNAVFTLKGRRKMVDCVAGGRLEELDGETSRLSTGCLNSDGIGGDLRPPGRRTPPGYRGRPTPERMPAAVRQDPGRPHLFSRTHPKERAGPC